MRRPFEPRRLLPDQRVQMHLVLELAARFQARQVEEVGDDPREPHGLPFELRGEAWAPRPGPPATRAGASPRRPGSTQPASSARGTRSPRSRAGSQSRRRASVTSAITARTDPSVPVGVAVTRSQRVGAPVSISAISTRSVSADALGSLSRRLGGKTWTRASGRAPRCRSMRSVREHRSPSSVEQEHAVLHRPEDLIADLRRLGRCLARSSRASCTSRRRWRSILRTSRRSVRRPTHTPTSSPTTSAPDDHCDVHLWSVGRDDWPFIRWSSRVRPGFTHRRRAPRFGVAPRTPAHARSTRSPDVHLRSTGRPSRLPSIALDGPASH